MLSLQELGSCFRSQPCTRARNCELGTVHRYLVALTVARVQSDKRSGELEVPVLVEVDSFECSSSLFIVQLTPNKVQPAGTVQLSDWLGSTAWTVSAETASELLPAIKLKEPKFVGVQFSL